MNSTYAQKSSPVQKAADTKAASVLDSSAQGESLQRKADMANNAAQRAEAPRPNNTGMPDNLKAGIESLSGFSMDDVRVHYNSSKPATVQALAYTQGTDIHVAPGQEKCLPHEAWHVAQQMAGRVSPTTNINGMPVNDNAALEHEADVMGEKAVQCKNLDNVCYKKNATCVVQKKLSLLFTDGTKKKKSEKSQKRDIEKIGQLYDLISNVNNSGFRIQFDDRAIIENPDLKQFKWWYFNQCHDLEIPNDCSDFDSFLLFVKQSAKKNFSQVASNAALLKNMIIVGENLTELGKFAYQECHQTHQYDDRAETAIDKEDFEQYVNANAIYTAYVNLNLKDPLDLAHQIAQDFLFTKLNNGDYGILANKIHHQYDDFEYGSKDEAKDDNDRKSQMENPIENIRVYRSMSLDDFLNAHIDGHGGPLGMALTYNTIPYVTVEFFFEKMPVLKIPKQKSDPTGNVVVHSMSEGSATTNVAFGRKSESVSYLPQNGQPHFYGKNRNSLIFKENKYNNIFSINFIGSDGIMSQLNPAMRVVFSNLGKLDIKSQFLYDYMKNNVHSYLSWKLYKILSKNVIGRFEMAEKVIGRFEKAKNELRLDYSDDDVARMLNFGSADVAKIRESLTSPSQSQPQQQPQQ